VIHEDEVDTCMPLLDNSYSDYSTKNADGSYNLKTYAGGECEGDPLYEYTFETASCVDGVEDSHFEN